MFTNKAVSALRTQSLPGKAVLHIIIRSSKYEMCHKRRISNVSGSKEEIAHSNFKFSGQVKVFYREVTSAPLLWGGGSLHIKTEQRHRGGLHNLLW